mgnify:FL=1
MVTVFEQGDIIYMDFCPQTGHEQAGRRPGLVISKTTFNRKSSMVMVCPITHTAKGLFFRPKLPDGLKTDGFVLCDQVRFFDIGARNARFEEKVPQDFLAEVVDLVCSLIEV